MKKKNKKQKWILDSGWLDVDELFKEATAFTFVTGGRSIGKTYGTLAKIMREAIKHVLEKQEDYIYFVWLRRYLTEIQPLRENFIKESLLAEILKENGIEDDVINEYSIEFVGSPISYIYLKRVQVLEDSKYPKTTRYKLGVSSSLSYAKRFRGTGYEKVDYIIFDEFQTLNAYEYMSNEVIMLFDIYESVARDRQNVKMIALGNAGSIVNPYFSFFKYRITSSDDIVRMQEDTVTFINLPNVAPTKKSSESLINKLTKGTEYGDYSISNKFMDDYELQYTELKDSAFYLYTLDFDDEMLSIYIQDEEVICSSEQPRDDIELRLFTDKKTVKGIDYNPKAYANVFDNFTSLSFADPVSAVIVEKNIEKYIKTDSNGWEAL